MLRLTDTETEETVAIPRPEPAYVNRRAEPPYCGTPIDPPSDSFPAFPGYEGASLQPSVISTAQIRHDPTRSATDGEDQSGRRTETINATGLPRLTMEGARQALLLHVGDKRCANRRLVEEMIVDEIVPSAAYKYTLESFCEKRMVCWKFQPAGNLVQPPSLTLPPQPWDIEVVPDKIFETSETPKIVEVPESSQYRSCHQCDEQRQIRCWKCCGTGQTTNPCWRCQGSGFCERPRNLEIPIIQQAAIFRGNSLEECMQCGGSGLETCGVCFQSPGVIVCPTCKGCGIIRIFLQLIVSWHNHMSDYLVERTPLPENLLREVSGHVVHVESGSKVNYLTPSDVQEPGVLSASKFLIDTHDSAFLEERIISQKQLLHAVPVSQVFYHWKSVQKSFVIYGFEQSVYAPDYPTNDCFSCCILM